MCINCQYKKFSMPVTEIKCYTPIVKIWQNLPKKTVLLVLTCLILTFQSMFDATLKDRKNSFHLAPGTSMFIHWLVGMVYVFYFASFILLLREVLRPGVLWFLRNLNDPEFNPIQEVGLRVFCLFFKLICGLYLYSYSRARSYFLDTNNSTHIFASFCCNVRFGTKGKPHHLLPWNFIF